MCRNFIVVVILVACFLLLQRGGADATLPIIFDSQDVFQPPIITCVHEDIIVGNYTTDCYAAQSAGCNINTNFCILSYEFDYQFNETIYNITSQQFASSYEGINDGKVEVCISFANFFHAPMKGTLQMWYYTYTTHGNDIYSFNYSQFVIDDYFPNLSHCFLFQGLQGGVNWIPVFWSKGGTQNGNGFPELGPLTYVDYVFRVKKPITLTYIPTLDLGIYDCTNFVPGYARVGYKIGGYVGIETDLLHAPSKGRIPVIRVLTQYGNTVESYYNLYNSTFGDFRICYYVLNMGGFKSNLAGLFYNATYMGGFLNGQPAVVVSLNFELTYAGMFGSQYGDTWTNAASRQVSGYYTSMAVKFLDMVQLELPDNFATSQGQATFNCNGSQHFIATNSRVIVDQYVQTDLIILWWARMFSQFCGGNGQSTGNFGWSHSQNSYNRGYNFGEGYSAGMGQRDFVSGNIFNNAGAPDTYYDLLQGTGPFLPIFYTIQNNTLFGSDIYDLTCKVIGTNIGQGTLLPNSQGANCYPVIAVFISNYGLQRFYAPPAGLQCATGLNAFPTCTTNDYQFTQYNTIGPPTQNCDCCNNFDNGGQSQFCTSSDTPPGSFDISSTTVIETGVACCGFFGGQTWATWRNAGSQTCVPNTVLPVYDCQAGAASVMPGTISCSQYFCSIWPINQRMVTQLTNPLLVATQLQFLMLANTISCPPPGSSMLESPTQQALYTNNYAQSYARGIVVPKPPDSQVISYKFTQTFQYRILLGTTYVDAHSSAGNSLMVPMYIKNPTIDVYDFRNSLQGVDGNPDTIEISFGVYCEKLSVRGATAYCAEQMTLVYANSSTSAIIEIIEGTLETTIPTYVPYPAGKVFGQVTTYTYFRFRILYQTGDLQVLMYKRSNPNAPLAQSYCTWTSPVIATTPPKPDIWLPLIAVAEVAAGECPYSPDTVIITARRGEFFVWLNTLELDLASTSTLGYSTYQQPDLSYFYVWNDNGTTIEGYAQEVQLYKGGITGAVYDRVSSVNLPFIVNYFLEPQYPNPLKRPPQCINPDLTSDICPVDPANDPYQYAGINEYQIWDDNPSPPGTPPVAYTILTPRLIVVYPFTVKNNIRSYFFNLTTEFIDIYIVSQQIAGFNYQQTSQVVYTSSAWTLFISYGRYDGPIQVTPCWERMITEVNVLSQLTMTVFDILPIPGCTATPTCCYMLQYTVTGNTPSNGAFINFDNTTDICYNSGGVCASRVVDCGNASDPCYQTCPCRYQILTSPALTPGGGYCLGATYQITVQNRASDVANRNMPNGYPAKLPYREPLVFDYFLPDVGLTPLAITVFPGSCDNPGNQFQIAFTVDNPLCDGPVAQYNMIPYCAMNVYVAFTSPNNPSYTYCIPTDGCLISGGSVSSYNFENTIRVPQIFGHFAEAIPNGYWTVYMWAVPASQTLQTFASANYAYKQSTYVTASLTNDIGMIPVLEAMIRPQCASSNTPMTLQYTLYDTQWNGPYSVWFSTPTGALISYQNLTVRSFPTSNPCCFNDDYALCVETCSANIVASGLPFTLQIGTGIYSPQESGPYNVSIFAVGSACPAQAFPIIQALDTFVVQVACSNTTCSYSDNALVQSSIFGGTPIPQEDRYDQASGGLSPYGPAYNCSFETPLGTLITCNVPNAYAGNYTLTVTDFNGCNATVSCRVYSRSAPITLSVAGEVPPNCTNLPAVVEFVGAGGCADGNLTVVRISNSTIHIINGSYIMQDANAVPGKPQLYAAMDPCGCLSPSILYTAENAPPFTLTININNYPCVEGVNDGSFSASSPLEYAPVYTFKNVQTGLTIPSLNGQVDNVPAGLYYVKATASFNPGCYNETYVTLYATGPPQVLIQRFADSGPGANVALGTFIAQAQSTNGPPFTYQIYPVGEPVDPPPYINFYAGEGTFPAVLTMTNLLNSFTFDAVFYDSNNCFIRIRSQGTNPPDTIEPITPTILPNVTYRPSTLEKRNGVVVLWVAIPLIIVIGFLGIIAFLAWDSYEKARRELEEEEERKKAASTTRNRRINN